MKTKIFTLLTLLLCAAGSIWAEDEVVFSADVISSEFGVSASGTREVTSNFATIIGGTMTAINKQKEAKNLIAKQGNYYMFCLTNNDTYFKIELTKALAEGDVISAKTFTRTDTNLGLFVSTASSRPAECSTKLSIAKAATESYAALSDYTITKGDGLVGATTIYIYRETAKSTFFDEFVITRQSTGPSISASGATVVATASGVEATKDIAVTGANLTGSTLTATLSPAVPGLSVTLASNTISDGAISTTATLHYTQTENASGTTTLTLSDGTTSKEVTVNYRALITKSELKTVSEATTWDWETSWNETLELTGETTPKNTEPYTMSDIAMINSLTPPGDFDAEAISFQGQYPVRAKKSQAGYWTIKTKYPGTLVVTFSDTGASGTGVMRYLNLNGKNTEYYTQRTGSSSDKKTVTINIEAGENTITGMKEDGSTFQAIVVYKMVYTPVTSTTVTVGEKLYRTFASKWPLTFPVAGLTAYKATVDGDNVTFTEVTGDVPAGEGLLLKAEAAGTYTINVPSGAVTSIDNALKGALSETVVNGAGIYVLYNGTNGLGFYKTTAATFTVGANTAYLPADVAASRAFIALDGEATGISAVQGEGFKADGEYFDLQGRRVTAPTKGLYIKRSAEGRLQGKNGRKVIVR